MFNISIPSSNGKANQHPHSDLGDKRALHNEKTLFSDQMRIEEDPKALYRLVLPTYQVLYAPVQLIPKLALDMLNGYLTHVNISSQADSKGRPPV